VFGQITTGAQDDLARASAIARKMVASWGMSPRLGPVYFGTHDHAAFRGRDALLERRPSEATAVEIDGEVRRIILEGLGRARRIVVANRDKLERLAEALLEHETVGGTQIDRLWAGQSLVPVA
jgi:cell division protease FtsH